MTTFQNEYQQAKAESGHTGHGFLRGGNVEAARIGEELLQKAVDAGVRKAGPVIERVLNVLPDDALPAARRLQFRVTHQPGADARGDEIQVGRLEMAWTPNGEPARIFADGFPDIAPRPVHRNAFGQLVSQVPNLTTPYLRGLIESGERWKHDLAETILREHFAHDPARYLVRTVGGEHRGLLSANYRRLDSRPLLDAFVKGCNEIGAVPYDGVASDVRAVVRAIVPRVFNVNGDVFCLGLTWQNSDFGAGAYAITGFILRLLCDNGAMTESELRQIHLGRKLDDAEIFSRRTYELDTETMTSATSDIVRALLSPKALEGKVERIQAAASREVEFHNAVRPVREQLTKGEFERAKEAFDGRDEWNLPAGKTQWRASNALSWIAKDSSDADRTIELEQMAGKLIPKAT